MYQGWICQAPEDCKFPFTYKGKKYTECTPFDHNRPWCSTTTDYVLKSGNWLDCGCKSIRDSFRKFKLAIICIIFTNIIIFDLISKNAWSLSGFTFRSTLITA